jgi:hypothetical protein
MIHPSRHLLCSLGWVLFMATTGAQVVETDSTRPHATNLTAHWAYQPVGTPETPRVRDPGWPRTSVDHFILARLEKAGDQPAPDAALDVLARRLWFDLTGLPPSPEDLAAFTQAARRDRKGALMAWTDRLLASPHFGEHWGRRWLDVARFGESVTLRGFIFREAWRYRDYVIDAFNADRPFDEFVREQIAGDLLPATGVSLPVRQRRLIATTFLALGNTNLEEQDKKQLDLDVVDEQLDTLGKVFLGQTLGCARCHDHKFDPIPARDYYAMAGILRNARLLKHANVSEWLERPLPLDPETEAALLRHEKQRAEVETELKKARETLRHLKSASGADAGRGGPIAPTNLPGIVVDSSRARAVGEWKHSTYSQRYVGDGYWHDLDEGKGTKTLSFAPEHLAAGRYEVRLAYIHADNRATNVPVTVFHAEGETVALINQRTPPESDGRFAILGRFRFESNGFANVLVGTEGTRGHVTADAVQFLPIDGQPAVASSGPGDSQPSSPAPADNRPAQEIKQQEKSIAELEVRLQKLRTAGPRRPMVMTVQEVEDPGDRPIQLRGSIHSPGAAVARGFLTVASRGAVSTAEIPAGQSGRRELAEWLASPENPLTARVYANRVWGWLLGEGLVRSVDNFGTTGDPPTHPALLDYLARRLTREGWSTKKLIREIVLSRTYQMAAGPSPEADPGNLRWSHAVRKRLTAEQMRDAMLSVSGQLERRAPHGPGFPSERSADYGFIAQTNVRSVYLPVFRNALPEFFEAFDFAPSSLVTGRRQESIVPTQALFLMNHPFVQEQAKLAARRLLAQPARDSDKRIEHAWRLALGRPPTAQETAQVQAYLYEPGTGIDEAPESSRAARWAELFQTLFAHADFRYLD